MPYLDISELNYARLDQLIRASTPEDRFLEYKREIGSNKDIAKDICAFANAQGGLILYGICEHEGAAIEVQGVEPQGTTELIDNVVANALSPRVNVTTRLIPIPSSDKAVLAVSIPESDQRPHMVSAYEDRRYYVRRNTTNIAMNQIETAEAYKHRTKAEEEADALARRVIDGRYSLRCPQHSWASLISVPKRSSDEAVPIDEEMQRWLVNEAIHDQNLFAGFNAPPGPNGFTIAEGEEPFFRYSVIGREGYVELTGMMDVSGRNRLPSLTLANLTMSFLRFCGRLYEHIGYYGMVKLFLGVDHVGRLLLGVSQNRMWVDGTPKFQVNEVHIYRNESAGALSSEHERICRVFMDRVYQAAGVMACEYFDPKTGALLRNR